MIWIGLFGPLMAISKFGHFCGYSKTNEYFEFRYLNGQNQNEGYGILMSDFKTVRHEWKMEQLREMMICKDCHE